MLAAMVSAAGGDPWVLPVARDTAKSLDAALARAATADLLLITGGVSAGKFDLVEPALIRAGARFHFTGVRIQPGKPLVFGEMPQPSHSPVQGQNGTKCCCFGLPGNPVSSAVTFLLFAAPVLAALAGTQTAALASPSRVSPRTSKRRPASPAFSPPPAPLPAPSPGRARSLAGLGRSRRHGPRQLFPGRARRRRSPSRRRDRPHSAFLRSPMPKPSRKLSHFDRIRPGRHGRRRLQAAHAPHRNRLGLRRAFRRRARGSALQPQGQSSRGRALRRHSGRQAHRRTHPHVPSPRSHSRRRAGQHRRRRRAHHILRRPPPAPPASKWRLLPPPPSPRSPSTT